jgi:hypothetical protein
VERRLKVCRLNVEQRNGGPEMTRRFERSSHPRVFAVAMAVIALWTTPLAVQPADPLWRFDTHG